MLTTSPRSLCMALAILIASHASHLNAQHTTFSLEVTSDSSHEPTRNFVKRESESSPFFGICSVIAGVTLAGLGMYSLAQYFEETDDHFLRTHEQRFETMKRRYAGFCRLSNRELEEYINEVNWQVRYYRMVTFKNTLERDNADLTNFIQRIEDRGRSLRRKLNDARGLSSLEYADICSIKKSLEQLYDECTRLNTALTTLLKRVINLPAYKEEEREKLREERERRHQREMLEALKKPTYVYVEEQRPSHTHYCR